MRTLAAIKREQSRFRQLERSFCMAKREVSITRIHLDRVSFEPVLDKLCRGLEKKKARQSPD